MSIYRQLWMPKDDEFGVDIYDSSLALFLPFWCPEADTSGSTIYSYDTNRRTCSVAGTVWGTLGRTFDGTDDFLSIPSIDYGTAFTLITWVKTTNLDTNEYIYGADKRIALWVHSTGYVQLNIGDGAWGNHINSSAGTIQTDTWYYIVGTYDGSDTELFVDCVSKGTAGNTKDISTSIAYIGQNYVSGDPNYLPWTGLIGDVILYNTALSTSELQGIYDITKERYS